MSSYIGKHAGLYDIFYAGKPYAQEAEFIHGLINKHGISKNRKMLELACGTGNHAIEFSRLGYDILATDYSVDMLEIAKQKLLEKSVKVALMDMSEVGSLYEKFGSVVCLFDSIGYLQTNKKLQATFNGVYKSLEQGGVFIVECWHAAAMIKSFEPYRERHFNNDRMTICRKSNTVIDYQNQTCSVSYDISVIDNLANLRYNISETQVNRFFLLKEIELLASISGFTLVSYFGGYDECLTIDEEAWHLLLVLKKL